MKRKSDSVCMPSTPKRSSLDNRGASSSPTADPINVDFELPETARLAHSKCFLMTENRNGKVLGCGEEVGLMPDESRFVMRIYNRDFNQNGKLKQYVEMTYEDFSKIHSHKSEIEKRINEASVRETIFDSNDFKVTVGPPGYSINKTLKPTVEIDKSGTRITMYIDTFTKMMDYLPKINEEYSRFQMRKTEEKAIVDEILNALAYMRNDKRVNGAIRQPNVGRKCGIYTTCCKIVEQAKMILPRDE